MARIDPTDVPDHLLDATIERLQAEKEARIAQRVESVEAVRITVWIVGDQDVEEWKSRALQDANVPPGTAVHFDLNFYEYPPMPDGSRSPMNSALRIRYDGSYDPLAEQPSPSSHRYPERDDSRYKPPKPQELIVGEPRPV